MSMTSTERSWVKIRPAEPIEDPDLGEVYDYWDRKRNGRLMPARADIDPVDLARHLGWIVLVDAETAPVRFRYRLIGSQIVDLVARDMTGRYLDDIYPPEVERVATASFRDIIVTRTPNLVSATMQHADRGYLTFTAIDLPLSSDGESVDVILIRVAFDIAR